MTVDGDLTPTPAAPEPGPSAWLQLSATLGDIGRGVGQLAANAQRESQRQSRAVPIEWPLRRGGTVPAGGTLVLDLGGPSMGRRWSVRSLAVSAPTGPTGTLAGSANWYVGNAAGFGGGEWCAPTMTTLPGFQLVGSDQINVTPTDHLLCVISGGTAGQAAIARAFVLDYPQYTGSPTIEL